MATLTETIREKLISAVENPAGLDGVLHEYAHSKGPFYTTLAQATAELTNRLKALSGKCKEAEKEYQENKHQIDAAQQGLANLNKETVAKTKELALLEEKVNEKKVLLDQAKELGGMGFGVDEFVHLHDQLAEVAATQGTKPKKAAAVFFKKVGNYQKLVAIESEIKGAKVAADKAKSEAEYWQAEVKTAEAKSKARKVTIDLTDKLLTQGVKESDLSQWTRILAKAGVAPEALAGELDKFGALEKVCQEREKQAQKLDSRVKEVTSQVSALNDERMQVTAGISAVRDGALSAMEITSKKAMEKVQVLADKAVEATNLGRQEVTAAIEVARQKALTEMECISKRTLENIAALMNKTAEFAALERATGVLEQEIALARAFRSQDPERWKKVSRRTAQGCLMGLLLWSKADVANNPFLPPPPRPLASKVCFYSWQQATLEEVLLWGLSGVFTEEERMMLVGK